MKNTIVILGNKKDNQRLKALIDDGECVIKPFCFVGYELTFLDDLKAGLRLSEAYRVLSSACPHLVGTVHLGSGEDYINFEGSRAEIIETVLTECLN